MNLLSIEGIAKSYSEKPLLQGISFGISEGDRIGLIGINGTGKTTLLRIVAGVEQPDEGRVVKGNTVRVEYLPQNPYFDPEAIVMEQVFRGGSAVMKLIREYEAAVASPDTPGDKLIKLAHDMDVMNAWSIESEARTVLTRLGISDFDAKVGTLSGGQRKRIALAAALINPSELLILDEPTNHLDNDTIDWLEQYLNKRKGALLMVTHDRYFLDRVVNGTLELDRGNLYAYKGNYNDFLEKKLEREELEAASEKKRQNLYRKELAWIKRGAKARTTKQKARIDRFNKLAEGAVELEDEKLEISVAGSRLGRKIIELEHIGKTFGDRKVIEDFSYTVLRDDRIGIIGPNGIGKSTLLNILYGSLEPDRGKLEIGETVRMELFSQETSHMDETLRAIEYIREGAEFLTTGDGSKITASQMLERFLFSSTLQWTPISKLSGGEKRRLHLLRVLMEAPNILLLDEPTNDLDIETLTVLEDYLEGFPGAVIAVSHDRYFLDKVAEKIFVFEGEGRVLQYTGNYTDYKGRSDDEEKSAAMERDDRKGQDAAEKKTGADPRSAQDREKARPLKFTYKEQKEYEEIDAVVAQLEAKVQVLDAEIGKAASDYTRLQQLLAEKAATEQALEEKMERWVYLNELAEKISGAKG